jgi:site-specific DNA-methyltransferase (adenine-specific)
MPKAKGLLKPAGEDWWIVRHRGSSARLNTEGCRLDRNDRASYGLRTRRSTRGAVYGVPSFDFDATKGRLPPNVTLDEEAAQLLDATNPWSRSRKGKPRGSKMPGSGWGMTKTGTEYDDAGGPSRFFYTARATSAERDAGLDSENLHPSVKSIKLMRFIVRLCCTTGGLVLDPFAGSGSTGIAAVLESRTFLGIESDPVHATTARRRIEWWQQVASSAHSA